MMHLIVGLGNPGDKYKYTRHNVGFMAVDLLYEEYSFDQFRHKFHGEYAQGEIAKKRVLLLKPLTFMNHSGIAVMECAHFFKIKKENIIVIHDELDLETGRIKIKTGGSNAGHNGLKSIDSAIGAEYTRLRFGISHPGNSRRVADYVLNNFSMDEIERAMLSLGSIAKNAKKLVIGDMSGFMNDCSRDLKAIID